MKFFGLAATLIFSTGALAHGPETPPHLDLEMESSEYSVLLKKTSHFKRNDSEDPIITSTIKLGARLSEWIAKVNASRTPETAIRLTSPTTRTGIPIDRPNTYSPSIIKQKLQEALSKCPEEMKTVLLSSSELPTILPVPDDVFITAARLVDKQYQSAARYKSVDAYRSHYIQAAKGDVRGLHFLKSNKIGEAELADLSKLPIEQLPAIKDALTKVCFNSPSVTINYCHSVVEKAAKSGDLSEVYSNYINNAETKWNNFFVIPARARRRDIVWEGNTATVPFNTPSVAKFIPYLQVNIEDEFRFQDWGLKVNFGTYPDGPYLKFETGVVPHVNQLGGNEIVMDSNQPIEEYESQWTIRHEFGHVLGLPDCYHEFYDTNLRAYVNYQLDVTDLMCSRAGNMKERIYQELRSAYAP